MKDHPPDLVLSGINMGANLGEDVHYSGTVAAALEATLLGVPAIAISQVIFDATPINWATAEQYVPRIVKQVCANGWPENVLISINLPNRGPDAITGVAATAQGKFKLGDDLIVREDPRGRPYIWIGVRRNADVNVVGTDLKAIDEGRIAVTPLNVDLTHGPTLEALRKLL
jgi:5'-nucleotidase